MVCQRKNVLRCRNELQSVLRGKTSILAAPPILVSQDVVENGRGERRISEKRMVLDFSQETLAVFGETYSRLRMP